MSTLTQILIYALALVIVAAVAFRFAGCRGGRATGSDAT